MDLLQCEMVAVNLSAKSRGQGPEASETLGIDMEIVPSVLIQGCSKDNRGGGHVGEGRTYLAGPGG